MKIGLIGFGKMGQGIAKQLEKSEIAFIVDPVNSSRDVPCFIDIKSVDTEIFNSADVIIEFSIPNTSKANVLAVLDKKRTARIVCGTTGWDSSEIHPKIKESGATFVHSTNYSIGINVLAEALPGLCKPLLKAGGFDASMVEFHHKQKLDSPSGTAKTLAEVVGKCGMPIPISDVRSGHFPGTHSIYFDSLFETIELTHTARDRSVFCTGAILAARWLNKNKNAGIFTFREVIKDYLIGG
jgi:4-hydroxy-tetrahydrodipicolinate reductase